MRMEGLVSVFQTIDRFEADAVVAALTAEGIPATVEEDSRRALLGGGLLGPGTHGADPYVDVLVPEDKFDEAHTVLAVVAAGEDSLPEAFRIGDDWDEHVATTGSARRRRRRRMVLLPLYALFALVVLVLVVSALNGAG